MLNEYVKKISLEFDADARSLQKVQNDIEKLKKLNLVDDKSAESLQKQLSEKLVVESSLKQLKDLQREWGKLGTGEGAKAVQNLQEAIQALEEAQGLKQEGEPEEKSTWKKIWEGVTDDLPSKLKSISKGFQKFLEKHQLDLKSLLKNAWGELETIMEFGKLSNRETRDLAFEYGFSSSQAYGYTKALKTTGLSSMEDLAFAKTAEKERFFEAFEKYSERYSQLYDDGFFEDMEEYNFEMAQFQEDMNLEIARFFMDNKELIQLGMRSLISLASFVTKSLGWVVNLLNGNPRIGGWTDTATQYNNTNNSRKTDIKFYNNFNNVSKSDESWLSNAGSNAYEQLVRALGS